MWHLPNLRNMKTIAKLRVDDDNRDIYWSRSSTFKPLHIGIVDPYVFKNEYFCFNRITTEEISTWNVMVSVSPICVI